MILCFGIIFSMLFWHKYTAQLHEKVVYTTIV